MFSTKAKFNTPSSLNGGFTGFQPYFNTVPEVLVGPGLGTYAVLNNLPGGNLMVYRPPGSSPVHPDHVSQATVNSIVSTEAFQTAVPIVTYSLFTVPRATVEIRYRMSSGQGAPSGPFGFGPRIRSIGVPSRPAAENRRKFPDFLGQSSREGAKTGNLQLGELSIQVAGMGLPPSPGISIAY